MKNNPSQIAVMSLEEGEDIFAGRVTPHIPQVGIYKLLAKKKVDTEKLLWARRFLRL